MRKRATLDEASNPLSHSSWHEKLMRNEEQLQQKRAGGPSTIRRLSTAMRKASMSKDDPETYNPDRNANREKDPLRANGPACRKLAGVEDWLREYQRRELNEEQKRKAAQEEWLATRFRRISLACFAGIALIGPMILMTLVATLRCSLSTTAVATLLFALLMGYNTSISERDIVVVTAGYAAVLVVFVGTQH